MPRTGDILLHCQNQLVLCVYFCCASRAAPDVVADRVCISSDLSEEFQYLLAESTLLSDTTRGLQVKTPAENNLACSP